MEAVVGGVRGVEAERGYLFGDEHLIVVQQIE